MLRGTRRTFFDWRREKHQMAYEALLKLQKISKIPLPKNIRILPEYWSTKKAARIRAKRRYELYGNPVPADVGTITVIVERP